MNSQLFTFCTHGEWTALQPIIGQQATTTKILANLVRMYDQFFLLIPNRLQLKHSHLNRTDGRHKWQDDSISSTPVYPTRKICWLVLLRDKKQQHGSRVGRLRKIFGESLLVLSRAGIHCESTVFGHVLVISLRGLIKPYRILTVCSYGRDQSGGQSGRNPPK